MGKRRTRSWRAAVAIVVLIGGLVGVTSAPAGAATCTLTPVLRDITINQGLGSYTPPARGKTTLVRPYLSLPSCATSRQTIAVTGASLTVTGGTATTTAPTPPPTAPFANISTYTAAPSLDSPADVKFVVPGSALDSAATGGFTATF